MTVASAREEKKIAFRFRFFMTARIMATEGRVIY